MTGISENTGRQHSGRFQKGVSGNPAGRPRGSRNKTSLLAEALLEQEAESLVRQLIDLAKAGDLAALRLCIERLVPKPKGRPLQFELAPISTAEDALQALYQILAGVGAGDLTAGEAQALVSMVETTLKAIEVHDLEQRLNALEERVTNAKH